MDNVGWRDRIAIHPNVCHGKPCIRGTRIMASVVLDYLSAGESEESILREYPQLSSDDVRAVLAYAAWLAHEEEQLPLFTDGMPFVIPA
ncbi:DUF433 domain-containing protein [Candidatus Poribacteria bacterium]|nr:DUF433 domain-containing protein [Candidatus Poribacteria bacterium]